MAARQQIIGLGSLLNVRDVDIEALEEEICGKHRHEKKESSSDKTKLYEQLMKDHNDFKRRFGVDYSEEELKSVVSQKSSASAPDVMPDDSISNNSSDTETEDRKETFSSFLRHKSADKSHKSRSHEKPILDLNSSESESEESESERSSTSSDSSKASSRSRTTISSASNNRRHHKKIKKSMYKINIGSEDRERDDVDEMIDEIFDANIQQFENNRDSKIERIESLLIELKGAGVKIKFDFKPHKLTNNQLDQLYKRLTMIRAGKRNKSLVQSTLIHAGTALETIFDGDTEYFGRFKIDMTGASNTMKTKLQSVEFETAEVASDIFGGKSISPWLILLLEVFIPVGILPFKNSQDKRSHQDKVADKKIANLIHDVKGS